MTNIELPLHTFYTTPSAGTDITGREHWLNEEDISTHTRQFHSLNNVGYLMTNYDKVRCQKYLKLNISLDFSLKGKTFQWNLCLFSRIAFVWRRSISISSRWVKRVRSNTNGKWTWDSILRSEFPHAANWFADRIVFIDIFISHMFISHCLWNEWKIKKQ